MFKKLLQTLGLSSSNPAPGDSSSPFAEKTAAQKESKDGAFLTAMQVFEDQRKSAMKTAEQGQEHAAKVNLSGKVDTALVAQLNVILTGIKKAEVELSQRLEDIGSALPTAAHGTLETMADKIAAAHNAVEKSIKAIQFAKLDFDSERDDDDDDGE